MIIDVISTFLSLHTRTNSLTDEDRTCNTGTITTSNDTTLSKGILIRVAMPVSWIPTNLSHVNLFHRLIFGKILFHWWRRSIINLIDTAHWTKFILLWMKQWHMSTRSTTLLISIRRFHINYFLIWCKTIWFFGRNKTLMLCHLGISTAKHNLSRVWTSANWTDVCLLYVIVCIKIRIDLHMIIVSSWLLRLNIAKERRILHITMERALRIICDLRRIVCMSYGLMLVLLSPLTA